MTSSRRLEQWNSGDFVDGLGFGDERDDLHCRFATPGASEGLDFENTKARVKMLRAGIAATRGDRETALAHLDAALAGFEACNSRLWVVMAKRLKGGLLGGENGRDLVAGADAWMASEGIIKPDRVTAAFVPGFETGQSFTRS